MQFDLKKTFTDIIKRKDVSGGLAGDDLNIQKNKYSFLDIITIILFIISLSTAVGLIGYNAYLNKSISSSLDSLTMKEVDLDVDRIQRLLSFFNRLDKLEDTIYNKRNNYTSMLSILDSLTIDGTTLHSVNIVPSDSNRSAHILISGASDSILTYLSQIKLFSKNPFPFEDKKIESFNIVKEKNNAATVNFSVSMNLLSETKEVSSVDPFQDITDITEEQLL